METYDSGDTAWVFACTALVMLLVVGLALLHSGMARSRNAVSVMLLALAAVMVVSVAWVFVGFSLAYGPDSFHGLLGSLDHAGLVGIADSGEFGQLSIPPIAVALFHMTVALVAAVIVTGVATERMKFSAMVAFMIPWSILVYPTVAHWVLGQDGWLATWGVLDFGSGTLVGITAGASALALALVLGPRRRMAQGEHRPHSLPLALAGAGLVWVGWIGVTAGSALEAGGVAASAALATHVAAVGGLMGYLMLEKRLTGVVTASGAAWGAIAGLAAITPAAGYLDPFAAIFLGFVAGTTAALFATWWRKRRKADDPNGSMRVHGVSAALGMIFVGLFGRLIVGTETEPIGAVFAGDLALVGKQLVAVAAVAVFAFVASWLLAFAVRASMGLRVPPEAEELGIDVQQHGQSAYGESD